MDSSLTTLAYLGTTEIAIIAGIVVLIFGAAKIPQLARGFGEGIREFKKSVEGVDEPVAGAAKSDTTSSSVAT